MSTYPPYLLLLLVGFFCTTLPYLHKKCNIKGKNTFFCFVKKLCFGENCPTVTWNQVCFDFYSTQMEIVISFADKILNMPPKSTWFEPKPLDGLVAYDFE